MIIRDKIRDDFTIKDKITSDFSLPDMIKTDILYPDTVMVSSSGPAAELYPDSLGEYRLRSNFTFNNFPVYEHSDRDDRFIINNGNHKNNRQNILYLVITAYFWFITRNISNTGLREFSTVRKDENLASDLDWQYNRYPSCRTDRYFN